MKKLILLLFVLFISIAACSQTITEQIVKYVPITEAQRDGLSPPSNQRWKIFNSTTGVFEYWNGTSWTIFSGGSGTTSLSGLTDVTITTPLANQVLTYNGTNWINQSIVGTGDMFKSIYDTNDDAVVDNSATLGGQIPNFYLDNTDTQNPLSDNIATTSSTVSASSTAVKLVNDKANANTSAILTKEDDLGNPSTNGYVLSSLTDGTRSWIANGSGGGSYTFNTPLSETGGVVSFDDSNYVPYFSSQSVNGIKFINRLNTSSPYMYFGNSDGISTYVGFYPQSDLGAYLGKSNRRWSAIHSNIGNFTGTVSGANAVNDDDFTTKLDLDTAIADANYATIADFVAGQVTALNVGNKSGTTYWTPQIATAFTTTGIIQGGVSHVICDTSGMTAYPTLDGNAPSIQSPTFVAGEHTMTIISYDGITVEHFFTKN